jgi:hypothetical protein
MSPNTVKVVFPLLTIKRIILISTALQISVKGWIRRVEMPDLVVALVFIGFVVAPAAFVARAGASAAKQ